VRKFQRRHNSNVLRFAFDDREIYPHRAVIEPLGAPGLPLDGPIEGSWSEWLDTLLRFRGNRAAAKALLSGLINEKIDVAYARQPLH
jgi:hypothetical protein